jgi:prepilin-type N-terminal cleavage/methylation domain-containing protein
MRQQPNQTSKHSHQATPQQNQTDNHNIPMKKPPYQHPHRSLAAFTLIELLVVIAILATLAGLVISRVDFARRQADMAAAADTTAELSRNVQTYVMTKGVLPDGLDSLLNSSGTISKWIYDSSPSLVPNGTTGNTVVVGATRTGILGSLGRMGVLSVMDLDDAATFASDAGTIKRGIVRNVDVTGSNTTPLLAIRPGSSIWNAIFPPATFGTPGAADLTGDGAGVNMPTADIRAQVGTGSTDYVRNISYGINTSVYLVVLGIGKGSSMNGVTLTNPPIYPAPDPDSRYYRYVTVLACFGDGRRAQFKTVLDPFGRTNADDVRQYVEAKPQ